MTFAAATIPNQTPTANAGPDQTVTQGTLTTLSGGDSYDYESGVTYAWTPALTNPETVTLSSGTIASPTFTPTKTGQYRFSLVVTDGGSVASTADEIIVDVVKELPASSTSFTYDGNGDRVKQTKGGVDTAYVVDSGPDNERVLMETTASATTYYIYGDDMLYSIDAVGPHYQHNDSVGSVAAITDASGALEQTYDYDVFGVMRTASGTSANRYTFTGEEIDASGLTYLRARYYNPATGRFLSRDPFPARMSDTQTLDQYAYAKNNPTNRVDPSGQFSLFGVSAGGAAVLSVAAMLRATYIALQMAQKYPGHNDLADAVRHATTSKRISNEMGTPVAAVFGDWYERENSVGGPNEADMDRWNNYVGRRASEQNTPIDWRDLLVIDKATGLPRAPTYAEFLDFSRKFGPIE